MRVHHLALKSPHPGPLAAWYEALLGLARLRVQEDEGGVRSVWLDLDGAILMIERAEGAIAAVVGEPVGWHGIYFVAAAGSGTEWEARLRAAGAPPTHRTAATLYAQDPEGNRFGLSAYPDVLFR